MNMKGMVSWCVLAYAAQALAGGAVLSHVTDAEVGTCGDGVAVFDDRSYQMTSAAAERLAGKTFFRRTIDGGFAAEVVKGGELFVVTPTEKEYFKGGFPVHLVGVLGGLIWGLGNGINLVAAGKAGTAISYGLGQGATLVSALWGILVWREFKGAPPKAGLLNLAMFVLFLAGLGLIIAAGA